MRKLRLFFCGRLFAFALLALLILLAGVFLSLWLPRALAPIAAAERIFSLAVALAVACDRSPAEYKISKTVLILFLPWMGAILCILFFSRPRMTDLQGGMSENPSSETSEGALAEALCGLKETRLASAEYFPVGREMYEKLLSDLKAAKASVFLEFYIVSEGIFWGDVLSVLEQKAAEGVEIRLIYDGFGCSATLRDGYEKELAARGVKARVFRPIRFPSRKAGRRDHRKLIVIDNRIAYTGGVNLADEYIGEKIRFGHWKDTAMRVTGAAAGRFSELFARTWGTLDPSPVLLSPAEGGNTPCAVIADDASERELRAGRLLLLRLIAGAKKRLYLNTPYLAPDAALMQAIESAALSGADVRLMIPHIPDKRLPFLLTRSYAHELERCGVRVLEYTDGFLHAKSVLSDDTVFVSSYNLDFRSLFLQAECGIAVKNKKLAETLARDFLGAWTGGSPLPAETKLCGALTRLLRLAAPLI